MRWIVAALVAVLVLPAARAGAGPLGHTIPPNCVAHGPMDNGVDLVDDYRCAGLAIEFHTAGVAFSPGPIWAGQWLFIDDAGRFRAGSCVFNRGLHPSIDQPAVVIDQTFPNDPSGEKSAYLTWRYGESADDLTAAGMWAVMHYYAQDAAGSRRATDAQQPLIRSLDMIGAASGRDDIESMAVALDAEANAHVGDWALAVDGDATSIRATLQSGEQPLAGLEVSFLVSGRDDPIVVPTDANGVARLETAVEGTVVATAPAPGRALVYQGVPAGRSRAGGQRLVTGGEHRTVTATIDVPPTTTSTTSTTTTTMVPETFPTLAPDTTVAESTSTSTSTSSPSPSTTTSEAPAVSVLAPQPGKPLPTTGRTTNHVAYIATTLLAAGIGVLGVASRRPAKGGHLHSKT